MGACWLEFIDNKGTGEHVEIVEIIYGLMIILQLISKDNIGIIWGATERRFHDSSYDTRYRT